jgi:hypothetical protein
MMHVCGQSVLLDAPLSRKALFSEIWSERTVRMSGIDSYRSQFNSYALLGEVKKATQP